MLGIFLDICFFTPFSSKYFYKNVFLLYHHDRLFSTKSLYFFFPQPMIPFMSTTKINTHQKRRIKIVFPTASQSMEPSAFLFLRQSKTTINAARTIKPIIPIITSGSIERKRRPNTAFSIIFSFPARFLGGNRYLVG